MTELDRGTLAKIDRRVLSGLGHDETWQMVRVPAAEATWAAWKRYCDSLGVSMGRGIAALIQHELCSVIDDLGDGPVFLAELEAEVALAVKGQGFKSPQLHLKALVKASFARLWDHEFVAMSTIGPQNHPSLSCC